MGTLPLPLWMLRSPPPETRELWPLEPRGLAAWGGRKATSKGKQDPCCAAEPGASKTLFNSEGMCAVAAQQSRPRGLTGSVEPGHGGCLWRRPGTHLLGTDGHTVLCGWGALGLREACRTWGRGMHRIRGGGRGVAPGDCGHQGRLLRMGV